MAWSLIQVVLPNAYKVHIRRLILKLEYARGRNPSTEGTQRKNKMKYLHSFLVNCVISN
jgi:hypothetical protein